MRSRALAPRSESDRLVVLLATPFLFETEDQALQSATEFASSHQIYPPHKVIRNRLRFDGLPDSTLIVSDHLGRLVKNLPELLKWLNATVDGHIQLLLPGCDLRESAANIQGKMEILQFLVAVSSQLKSVKIREGLAIRKSRGLSTGRVPISDEIRKQVLTEYSSQKSVRAVARSLKSQGISISKSKVGQILKEASGGKS